MARPLELILCVQRMLKFGDFIGDADGLIMENHADQVISRGVAIWIETSRFVDKDTNLTYVIHIRFSKTKARIAPRLRQESFPRASDSGFRPCQHVLYHNCGFGRNGGNLTFSDAVACRAA